ncbi:MAG: RNA-binding S4 domain-containing protein [Brevinema sp.]
MRLDKWLKVALIFKQRSQAVAAIESNKIRVNGAISKSAKLLKVGDKIVISRELGEYQYTILKLAEKNVTREIARDMYELIVPEQIGTEDEKLLKKIERAHKQEHKRDWNQMYDDKKKQRQLRSHKYRQDI